MMDMLLPFGACLGLLTSLIAAVLFAVGILFGVFATSVCFLCLEPKFPPKNSNKDSKKNQNSIPEDVFGPVPLYSHFDTYAGVGAPLGQEHHPFVDSVPPWLPRSGGCWQAPAPGMMPPPPPLSQGFGFAPPPPPPGHMPFHEPEPPRYDNSAFNDGGFPHTPLSIDPFASLGAHPPPPPPYPPRPDRSPSPWRDPPRRRERPRSPSPWRARRFEGPRRAPSPPSPVWVPPYPWQERDDVMEAMSPIIPRAPMAPSVRSTNSSSLSGPKQFTPSEDSDVEITVRRSKPLRCFTCWDGFETRNKLNKHLREEHSKKHRCRIGGFAACARSFETKGDLRRHVRDKHEDDEVQACPP